MPIATISNGEDGLSVRQKLNSGVLASNYLLFPDETNVAGFSYIDPIRGSDISGNGSLANPYQSIGAAYSGGSLRYMLMPGDAGVLDIAVDDQNTNFTIYGTACPHFWPSSSSTDAPFAQSFPQSYETPCKVLVKNNNATTSHIHIASNNAVLISLSGIASYALGAGIEAAIYNAIVGNVTLNGDNGTSNESENAGNGGNAGILYLGYSTVAGDIVMNGGSGGPGINGFNGGNGGDGGSIAAHYSRILGTVSLSGGAFGLGDDPGVNGSNGSDGLVYSAYSMFTSAPVGTGAPTWRYSLVNGATRP